MTDEASAMSLAGHSVGLVKGHWQNNKLTEPDDWPLVEWVLQQDD
ncbi:MAG: 2-C-methyl-D-erythritol 4-phosphate cytidylyltransferase [Natronospirillum sp.]